MKRFVKTQCFHWNIHLCFSKCVWNVF